MSFILLTYNISKTDPSGNGSSTALNNSVTFSVPWVKSSYWFSPIKIPVTTELTKPSPVQTNTVSVNFISAFNTSAVIVTPLFVTFSEDLTIKSFLIQCAYNLLYVLNVE